MAAGFTSPMSPHSYRDWSPASKGVSSQSMSVLQPSQRHPPEVTNPLHSASVYITDFPEMVNPQPWEAEFEGLAPGLGQDYLSPRKLSMLTGEKNLRNVTYLELSVDSSESSLGNFGVHLPNLCQLRITSGVVPCVRDLGTSLTSLTVLWMPRCKLRDLDGLPALERLRELYLSFNEISDVCLVSMLPSLEVLDLESNELSDLDQLGYLSLCPALAVLTLEGNPLCSLLADQEEGSEKGYRLAIFKAIPNLKTLDDLTQSEEPQTAGESEERGVLASHSSLFVLSEAGMKEDWHLVTSNIKNQSGVGLKDLEEELDRDTPPLERPSTAPVVSRGRQSASPPPPSTPSLDDSSELTHGLSQVICGNPVRALRQRKRQSLTSQSSVTFSPTHEQELLARVQGWRLDAVSEANIHVGKATSAQQPDHFIDKNTPSYRLPTPPKATPTSHHLTPRPQTVADFRHRRYRKASTERSFTEDEGKSFERDQTIDSVSSYKVV